MQKIEKTKLLDEKYISNNYLYYIKNLSNETLYYIFMCNGIISNSPLVYSTNKCYCFSLPKNISKKTYLYDDIKNVEILPHSDLYFKVTYNVAIGQLLFVGAAPQMALCPVAVVTSDFAYILLGSCEAQVAVEVCLDNGVGLMEGGELLGEGRAQVVAP